MDETAWTGVRGDNSQRALHNEVFVPLASVPSSLCLSRVPLCRAKKISKLYNGTKIRSATLRCYLRTDGPEGPTAQKYLPPGWSNQLDSGGRGHGRKTHLDCNQFDYTCGIHAASFDAPVDVTGAGWCPIQNRVVRFHRRGLLNCVRDGFDERWTVKSWAPVKC